MAGRLPRLLAAGAFALAAVGVCAPAPAAPAGKHPKAEAVLKKSRAKPKKAKAAAAAAAAATLADVGPEIDPLNPEQAEPDITDTVVTEYACELNNKITIYTNEKDDAHIALRWKKRLHRLQRVGTTTGAQRFENPFWGLIWIGIPAKGILLDSRLNRQLANECKTAQQAAAQAAALPEEKKS
jgi:membrane-bound inhibitor of C-type lysozyme